jgi:hypothetical protein
VPLAEDAKKALQLSAEEADRLKHRHVGTGHILAGLLRVQNGLAAKILLAKGVTLEAVRSRVTVVPVDAGRIPLPGSNKAALETLNSFLAGLKWLNSEQLTSHLAENAAFVDACGRKWIREEIEKDFKTLFAPYAKKNVTYVVETPLVESRDNFVTSVVWRNALVASEQRAWVHRMSFVLLWKGEEWEIVLAQVTPAQLP